MKNTSGKRTREVLAIAISLSLVAFPAIDHFDSDAAASPNNASRASMERTAVGQVKTVNYSSDINTLANQAAGLRNAAANLMSIKWNTSLVSRQQRYQAARNALQATQWFWSGSSAKAYASAMNRLNDGITRGNLVDASDVLRAVASSIDQQIEYLKRADTSGTRWWR